MKIILCLILTSVSLSSYANFSCNLAEKAMNGLATVISNIQDQDTKKLLKTNLSNIQFKYLNNCVDDGQLKKDEVSCPIVFKAINDLADEYPKTADKDIKEIIQQQIGKLQTLYIKNCTNN